MMDVEEIPPTQEVLDAVSSLRNGDGVGRMQLDLPWEGDGAGPSPGDGRMVIVVDTNVLISHLALLRDFTDLASSSTLPPSQRPLLLIPHIVVAELDGLKSSTRAADVSRGPSKPRGQSSIASLARAATNWLLHALAPDGEDAVVRGQRRHETLFGAEGAPVGENNDSLVLDAALYHAQRGHARVVLLTDDRNLQLRATIEQVEALGVEDGMDASRLLERLALPAASAPHVQNGRHARPPLSPEQSRHGSPAKVQRRRSPPSAPAPLPSPPPLVPTPPTPARPPARRPPTPSMELDPPTPPPVHVSLPPPTLYPVRSPPDIFLNASLLLSHFLALPLYRHAYEHLRRTRIAQQGEWQPALGDWREWGARECVDAARRWWSEGDVEGLCRVGIEAALSGSAAPPSPLAQKPPLARPPRARSAPASTSRWAAPPLSRAPPAPAPNPRTPTPSRAPPSSAQQLRDLHNSLPVICSALAVPPASTASWSAPRWEVLLEGVGALLRAVLGGAVRGDVRGEVGKIVGEWVEELSRLGVRVTVEV